MIDLLVAGGGPAGLATAIHAARAGLDVVVAEPRPGPVDKACGEGLMPAAVHALADLGVAVGGRPLRGIRYVDARYEAEAHFRAGPGRGCGAPSCTPRSPTGSPNSACPCCRCGSTRYGRARTG